MTQATLTVPTSTAFHAGFVINQKENPVSLQAEWPPLFEKGRERAIALGLCHAGSFLPHEAWQLVQAGRAVLVDVRTAEERKFVGHVPGSLHVAWVTGLSFSKNPRFLKELENRLRNRDAPALLICRSGKRSAEAAEAATRAGFGNVFNVLQGFEGDLDNSQQRGAFNGWRYAGLPWIQD
jgi:rhodanese-related sulfurtransferase